MDVEEAEVPHEPEESRPSLKRLRRLRPCDVKGLQCDCQDSAEEQHVPKNVSKHRGQKLPPIPAVSGKYGLPKAPAFVGSMESWVGDQEPPQYGSQGVDVGKKRGRKPLKPVDSKDGKQKHKSKGNKPKSKKSKKVRKGKKRALSAASPEPALRQRPARGGSKLGRYPKKVEIAEPSQRPQHHGKERVPPEHVTSRHAYSSAYRKHESMGLEYAREAAKMASRLFMDKGVVDDLCGDFRAKPRRSRQEKIDS